MINHARHRGTAITETALAVPIILFFLAMTYGLFRLATVEQSASLAARRQTMEKNVRFQALEDIEAIPDRVSADRLPAPVELPDLSGDSSGDLLRSYESLPNASALGGGWDYLEAYAEVSANFGDIYVVREGLVVRPPWTVYGFPRVNTQHPEEAGEVLRWYFENRDSTLNDSTRRRLGLRE